LLAGFQGHDSEKERLVMEMEAVIQEQASLENQLASLGTLISNLASEVEEQKSTVSICIYFDQIFFCSARLFSQPYEQ